MFYVSEKWNDIEIEGRILGFLNIISQGRSRNPVLVAAAISEVDERWNCEVALVHGINLAHLSEDDEAIMRADTEQAAVDLINEENDPAAADLLDSLGTTGSIGGHTESLISMTFPLDTPIQEIKNWLSCKAQWNLGKGMKLNVVH